MVAFIVISGVVAPLSHANLVLPAALERVLGWLVLTPRLHRTHHSRDPADSDTNFGVAFTVWDRVFGTLKAAPAGGHEHAAFGVESRSTSEALSPARLLADPFLPERSGDAPATTRLAPGR